MNGRVFGGSPVFAAASLPVLLLFGACVAWLLVLSVFHPSVYSVYVAGLTGENYARVFTSRIYQTALLRSVRLALVSTAVTLAVGYPMAFHICRGAGRMRKVWIALVAAVLMVTFVVKIYAWQLLLERSGAVDVALRALRLTNGPTRLIGTETGVLTGLVYASLPYTILVLVGGIEKIPQTLEHAAACTGAGPGRVFWTVTAPLSMPAVVTAGLFAFALSVAAFVVPALLGAGQVPMAGLVIQRVSVGLGTAGGDWPLAAALSAVLLAASALFSLLLTAAFARRRWRLA